MSRTQNLFAGTRLGRWARAKTQAPAHGRSWLTGRVPAKAFLSGPVAQWLGLVGVVLGVALSVGGPVRCSGATLLYETRFEASEGYNANLDLAGQKGWRMDGSGGNGLMEGVFPGQGQHAFIGRTNPDGSDLWVYQTLDLGVSQAQFTVTLAVEDSSNEGYDNFCWAVYNAQGDQLVVIDFDNYYMGVYYSFDGNNDWLYSGLDFDNGVTYQLALSMDFSRNCWSATLNGRPLATSQPLTTTGAPLNLGDIDASWLLADPEAPGDNYMVFDNYSISGTLPAPQPEAAPLFQTGFEASEGYSTNLNLLGQQDWNGFGSGDNGLLTDFFAGQGQQAYVGRTNPDGEDLYVYQALNQNVSRAQFTVTLAVVDSSNTNYDDFCWEVYNAQGDRLLVIDFYNYDMGVYYSFDGTNDWLWSGLDFHNGVTYQLGLSMDFSQNCWSATLNGIPLVTNQPLTTTGAPLNLGDIDACWLVADPDAPGDNFMVFDNYSVSGTVPAPQLQLLSYSGRTPRLRLSGQPDTRFALEGSTNLVNWVGLSTNLATGGFFEYTDTAATALPQRFYRGRWVPQAK